MNTWLLGDLTTPVGATEAAERGDFHDALTWLDTVEVVKGELPAEFLQKRRQWERLAQHPADA